MSKPRATRSAAPCSGSGRRSRAGRPRALAVGARFPEAVARQVRGARLGLVGRALGLAHDREPLERVDLAVAREHRVGEQAELLARHVRGLEEALERRQVLERTRELLADRAPGALRPLREGEVRGRLARARRRRRRVPSDSATKNPAMRMSVPRIEARQRKTADRSRRTVNRLVSAPDPVPLLPAPLPTGGLCCGAIPTPIEHPCRRAGGCAGRMTDLGNRCFLPLWRLGVSREKEEVDRDPDGRPGPGRGRPGRGQEPRQDRPQGGKHALPARQGPGRGPPGLRPRGRRRRPGDQGGREVGGLGPRPLAAGARGRRRQERATCSPRSSRTSTRRSRSPTSRRASRTMELKLQDAERDFAMQKALFEQGLIGRDPFRASQIKRDQARGDPARRADALPDRRGPRHSDLRQRRPRRTRASPRR